MFLARSNKATSAAGLLLKNKNYEADMDKGFCEYFVSFISDTISFQGMQFRFSQFIIPYIHIGRISLRPGLKNEYQSMKSTMKSKSDLLQSDWTPQ